MSAQSLTIHFDSTDELDPKEVADFFFLFNSIYALAKKELVKIDLESYKSDPEKYCNKLRDQILTYERHKLSELISSKDTRELSIISLSKRSPLEITVCGCLIGITAAVIFGGGSVDFLGWKC